MRYVKCLRGKNRKVMGNGEEGEGQSENSYNAMRSRLSIEKISCSDVKEKK